MYFTIFVRDLYCDDLAMKLMNQSCSVQSIISIYKPHKLYILWSICNAEALYSGLIGGSGYVAYKTDWKPISSLLCCSLCIIYVQF